VRYHSYLNTAKKIIETFTGAAPLSAYLKKFFAADKKYGSKDRKQIAALCYNYYRLGKALRDIPVEEKIILSTFLCERSSNDFLEFHKADWNSKIIASTAEKLLIINYQLLVKDIFPWSAALSDGIDQQQFAAAFLQQPDLFVRIRPGKKDIVVKKFNEAGLPFQLTGEGCIALPNSSKLDAVIELDKEAVVQDHNSQKVLDFLRDSPHPVPLPPPPSPKGATFPEGGQSTTYSLSVWDCCAASGGKSILAYDILQGNIELTVSDIREGILANLKKRFTSAGIKSYESFIVDLNIPDSELPTQNSRLPTKNYQLIICDAPCTGSGTWSRTPEQLYYFHPATIMVFAERQKQIVSNAIPHLQKDGLFFYITCSVFKDENEVIVNFIKEKFHLQLLQMELLKGYDKKADTMFVAVFRN
jgi:16S rRNA (cytosine967-C5)-methyltransferase